MQLTEEYTHDISGRYRLLKCLILLLLVAVIGRLFWLQVVDGDTLYRFSQNYSIRDVMIPAPRGMILDRHGKVIADNQPAVDLVIIPQYVVNWDALKRSLIALLHILPEDLDAAWERRRGKPSYQPIAVMSDLPLDMISVVRAQKTPWYFSEDKYDLRGVDIVSRATRRYTDGTLAAHVLGYLKETESGDMEGATGIEAVHDAALRGVPGRRERIVNAHGRVVDYPDVVARLSDRAPVPGSPLQLSLDMQLQAAARRAFGKRSGAVVALDPKTGEVLALYSSPSYDLAALTGANRAATWRQLSSDTAHPLYNRVVQGTYPPGSTYKMVTALAAVMEDEVTPEEQVVCRGGMEFGGRRFGCWNKGGHGAVSLTRAIAESCDVYFYVLGHRLGLDRLAQYAHLLGLGQKTGIDLPNEKRGNIPTSDWKMQRFGRDVMAGDVISAAIGQGYDTLTPLQDALMVARLVNGGVPVVPHVVMHASHPPEKKSLAIDPEKIAPILRGMEAVVNAPGGTARHLASYNLKIAGKTGTAQTTGYDSKVQKGDHAWFVGYAPYDNPQIVVAAIVEYGGHGGSAAAPIVGELIKTYLQETRDVGK